MFKELKGDLLETKENFRRLQKNVEKKRKMRILKHSHSAEKLRRGDPLGFLKLQFAISNNLKGGTLIIKVPTK